MRPVDPIRERDARIIARVMAGERELFHELIRPYEKGVYLAAYSLFQNEADAEEVAQEAVLKAYRNLANFRGDAKFSTWLIAIALNEARGRLRHARVIEFDSIDEPIEEGSDVTSAVISDWREVPATRRSRGKKFAGAAPRGLSRACRKLTAKSSCCGM